MAVNKSGVWVLACMLVLVGGSVLRAEVGENTKIYTIFANKGCSCPAGGTPEGLTTNAELLRKLQKACRGVDFIARDMTKRGTTAASILDELKDSKDNFDGVLIIGVSREYQLAFSGLPTIFVYNLFEWMNVPYKLYDTGKEQDRI